ncbi:MAG TPA: hypothetical protein VFC79_05940 [Tissierellaceae bacterium]|nr:hypothetical protein [Tissierellaceae bacterium]
MAKGIFIAENMASTKVGSLLRSATQATAIENGALVKLDGLVSGEIDLYNAKPIAAITDVAYIVDGVELIADESTTKGLDDFENPANVAFRVRKPQVGDRFSISESMITALSTTVVVDNIAEIPATGNKLAEVAKLTGATATATLVCNIVDRWTFGTRVIPMVRLEVVKA